MRSSCVKTSNLSLSPVVAVLLISTHFNYTIKLLSGANFLSLSVLYEVELLQRCRQGDGSAQFRRSLDVFVGAGPGNGCVTVHHTERQIMAH